MGIGPAVAIPELLNKSGKFLKIQAKKLKILIFGKSTRPLQVKQLIVFKNWVLTRKN